MTSRRESILNFVVWVIFIILVGWFIAGCAAQSQPVFDPTPTKVVAPLHDALKRNNEGQGALFKLGESIDPKNVDAKRLIDPVAKAFQDVAALISRAIDGAAESSKAIAEANRRLLADEAYREKHKNDWFGPAMHRLFWTTLIGGGLVVVAFFALGFGGLIPGFGKLIVSVGTLLFTLLTGGVTWLHEWADRINKRRQARRATVTPVVLTT